MADAKKQGGNVPKKPRNSGKPAKKKSGQIPVVKAGGGGKSIPWEPSVRSP
jgi:hypothetical protein